MTITNPAKKSDDADACAACGLRRAAVAQTPL
jgi:hypothetical protein